MSSDALIPSAPRPRAVVAAGLRVSWFVLVPALLTALVLRYLLASPVQAPQGALRALSEWAETRQPVLAVGFFLLFSTLFRYWRARLPSAQLWADPPASSARAASLGNTLLWGALFALAALLALAIRGSAFQGYRVLSGSMLPTLQPGEVLLSKQFAYGARLPWSKPRSPLPPRRGDIVVFQRPPLRADVPEELVKRVIGLPGDTVSTFAGFATINGWRVPTCNVGPYVFVSGDGMLEAELFMEFLEDQVYLTAHAPALPEPSEPYTVKSGETFVLGDNRNNSSDSRAWNDGHGGGLRFEEIRGKVERFLRGQHRNGNADFSLFWQRLGLEVRGDGIDNADLRQGIARCLKARPAHTVPPRAGGTP